jgi:type II secretory ATPase GspE/PulE/Tfp pilus assembly ATPase PilB-like protein
VPVAEIGYADESVRQAILARSDTATLQQAFARQPGYRSLRDAAQDLAAAGVTTSDEARRSPAGPA